MCGARNSTNESFTLIMVSMAQQTVRWVGTILIELLQSVLSVMQMPEAGTPDNLRRGDQSRCCMAYGRCEVRASDPLRFPDCLLEPKSETNMAENVGFRQAV